MSPRVLQSRRAKARLSKFRTQLQVEISRLGGLIIRAKKSVKAFEVQSKREEAQLVRVGMRKHLGLHRYYSSLKVTGLGHASLSLHSIMGLA